MRLTLSATFLAVHWLSEFTFTYNDGTEKSISRLSRVTDALHPEGDSPMYIEIMTRNKRCRCRFSKEIRLRNITNLIIEREMERHSCSQPCKMWSDARGTVWREKWVFSFGPSFAKPLMNINERYKRNTYGWTEQNTARRVSEHNELVFSDK